jgi:uncharacterized protein involved in outer membrane biogenesis
VLAIIGGALLAMLLAILLDTGHFKAALLRAVAARIGRPIDADTLHVRLLSLHPRAVASGVTIGNPAWMPAGSAAEIAKLTVVFDLPGIGHGANIAELACENATLHLARDSAGRSNWQSTAPDRPSGSSPIILHSLSLPRAHVELDDERRHIKFRGMVSAGDASNGSAPALLIKGSGELNGREAEFEVTGDALATARHDAPYHFSFVETSSGSRLSGDGSLPRPFDFNLLDAAFAAAGADLKDLYFLTGVTLINTGNYVLEGKFVRRGSHTTFSDLAVTSGQSDMHGAVSVDAASDRPQVRADIFSKSLRLSDLGAKAAGRDNESAADKTLLLSNAAFTPSAARHGEAAVSFHAGQVQVGRIVLQSVDAHMTLDHGVIVIDPLEARALDGTLAAHIRIDASKDDPSTDVDLKISNAQLGLFLRKGSAQAPMEGLLRARVHVKGRGSSVHQVAATSNGTVAAVLSHGALRSSLAELTGIDLRGLGLMLAKSTQETPVLCGVASFRADSGTLTAQSLVVDTDAVLISGEGAIHLDSEALDLKIRGRPKTMRLLRLRMPLIVQGTLTHPTAGIHADTAAAQTAGAVALGVLATPLASVLAFVDPGHAEDADCAALSAQPKT